MLLLDLLNYVIVFIVIFYFCLLLKSGLSHAKARLFDNQIRIFLLLFDHSCGNIVVDDIVSSYSRSDTFLINDFSFNF